MSINTESLMGANAKRPYQSIGMIDKKKRKKKINA